MTRDEILRLDAWIHTLAPQEREALVAMITERRRAGKPADELIRVRLAEDGSYQCRWSEEE